MAPAHIGEESNAQSLVSFPDLRQKNSCLPVSRLPPETLADIFIHGARDYYHELNSRKDDPALRVPDWVNVSYVCCHWRDIALSCPTLWTYHFTVSPRWTEELLARSKQVSLKICICYTFGMKSWLPDLVEKVLNHAERIQELHLNVSEKVLPKELSLYAPRLQTLDIFCWDSPSAVKHGHIHPLHTLKLIGCPLLWHSSFNLSGITTLFLRSIPSSCQQNLLEFLATLSRMPALAVLHLEDVLPSARGLLSSGAFNVFPTSLSLPCLARFFVVAPLSTVVALLSCINIPLKTQLELQIKSEKDSFIDGYAQLPSLLAQRFVQSKDLSSSSPAIRSLFIDLAAGDLSFIISALESGDCNPDLSIMAPPQDHDIPLIILVEIEPRMSMRTRDYLVADICCSIPSIDVETLHVIYPTDSSHDLLSKTLGHFDRLRHLKLSTSDMPDLVSLLSLPADKDPRGEVTSDGDPTRRHTLVPALKELTLDCMWFVSDTPDAILDGLSTRKALSPGYVQMINCMLDKYDLLMVGDDGDGRTLQFTSRYLYDSCSGKYYLKH